MTRDEMTDKIVKRAGVTRLQAEQALELNNDDLLEAMIYVEKTYSASNTTSSSSFSTNFGNEPEVDYSEPNTSSAESVSVNEQKSDDRRGKSSSFVEFITLNGISVYHNDKMLGSIPLALCILLFFISWSAILGIVFISMFFGIKYTFFGEALDKEDFNKILIGLYDIVQGLKSKLTSN